MSNRGNIKTTGDLRAFLSTAMEDVRAGMLDLDKAKTITKIAGQVNESFYAEIKTAKVRQEFGETVSKLGGLTLDIE